MASKRPAVPAQVQRATLDSVRRVRLHQPSSALDCRGLCVPCARRRSLERSFVVTAWLQTGHTRGAEEFQADLRDQAYGVRTPSLEVECDMPIQGDLLTALIAGLTVLFCASLWVAREVSSRDRRRRVEAYLRSERKSGENRGHRSTLQIMRALQMTAGQVSAAARRSRVIKRLAVVDGMTSAEAAVFECAPLY